MMKHDEVTVTTLRSRRRLISSIPCIAVDANCGNRIADNDPILAARPEADMRLAPLTWSVEGDASISNDRRIRGARGQDVSISVQKLANMSPFLALSALATQPP